MNKNMVSIKQHKQAVKNALKEKTCKHSYPTQKGIKDFDISIVRNTMEHTIEFVISAYLRCDRCKNKIEYCENLNKFGESLIKKVTEIAQKDAGNCKLDYADVEYTSSKKRANDPHGEFAKKNEIYVKFLFGCKTHPEEEKPIAKKFKATKCLELISEEVMQDYTKWVQDINSNYKSK